MGYGAEQLWAQTTPSPGPPPTNQKQNSAGKPTTFSEDLVRGEGHCPKVTRHKDVAEGAGPKVKTEVYHLKHTEAFTGGSGVHGCLHACIIGCWQARPQKPHYSPPSTLPEPWAQPEPLTPYPEAPRGEKLWARKHWPEQTSTPRRAARVFRVWDFGLKELRMCGSHWRPGGEEVPTYKCNPGSR